MPPDMKTKILIILGCLIAVFALAGRVTATPQEEGFNPNFILADDALLDFSRMTADQIQAFLTAHADDCTTPGTCPLATYTTTVDGVAKTAAQIIYDASQLYQINPQFILVTLQKEESLIDGGFNPASLETRMNWALGYSVCDNCGGTGSSQYKGFVNQINAGAKQIRKYLTDLTSRGYTVSGYGPGRTSMLDCLSYEVTYQLCTPAGSRNTLVVPANNATAILYTYTPHFHGNYNFWRIWRRYNFSFQRFYPDGSVLRATGQKDIYLVSFGQLRKFKNDAVFLSTNSYKNIITVPADHLLPYSHGRDIAFPNYSLLSQPRGGVYLLVDDTKRPIGSKAVFKAAGFQPAEVIKASWDDLNQFTDGPAVTMEDIFPSGMLYQHKTKGYIVYVKDGILQPVHSKDIMRTQFGLRKPVKATGLELAKFTKGKPVKFKDGTLVQSKSGGPVYVISDGQKLPIPSQAVFQAYRYNIKNVIKTTDFILNFHPLGPELGSNLAVQSASSR